MEWILALVAGVIVGGVGFFWFSRKKNPVEDNSFLLIQQQLNSLREQLQQSLSGQHTLLEKTH